MPRVVWEQLVRSHRSPYEAAVLVRGDFSPEGVDVRRIRFVEDGLLELDASRGHIVSVVAGRVEMFDLQVRANVHAFVPVGAGAQLRSAAGTELVCLSGVHARGRELMLRDEEFLRACAVPGHPLRWVLTSQYLSRRIFLHHDSPLLSRAGQPVSWFRTTMFDVAGLPPNADGEPVFKMSYDSRTEINVCYEVVGRARVRIARHPYGSANQTWENWVNLDGSTTYHLDEVATPGRSQRNRHEVAIEGGHVTLFCAFDPAPTGVERHHPGQYSDYEPFEAVIRRREYAIHRDNLTRFDAMVNILSMARARGELDRARRSSVWPVYVEGWLSQRQIEKTLLVSERSRSRVIRRWLSRTSPSSRLSG